LYAGPLGRRLWVTGSVQWSWVLAATLVASTPGSEVWAAAVLFSDEPGFNREPSYFAHVAKRVETARMWWPQPRPGMRVPWTWARSRTERYAASIEQVPFEFTEGAVVWRAGVLCHQEVLPAAALHDGLLLLVRSAETDITCAHLLPQAYWPPLSRSRWEPAESAAPSAQKPRPST
jgi:hypothetical protein